MIDRDVYATFVAWYVKDIDGDELLGKTTPDGAIAFARQNRCLDEVLQLPGSGVSMREFFSRNFIPLFAIPEGTGWWSEVHCSGSPTKQS